VTSYQFSVVIYTVFKTNEIENYKEVIQLIHFPACWRYISGPRGVQPRYRSIQSNLGQKTLRIFVGFGHIDGEAASDSNLSDRIVERQIGQKKGSWKANDMES